MPRRIVDLHPEAIAEGREARRWYAAQSPQAAERFRQELKRAIRSIGDAPERWPPDEDGLRRLRLNGFPYSLVYWTDGNDSLIVSVAHAKRRPEYWRRRLG
jgi:plasmid stabilization system protein ParE